MSNLRSDQDESLFLGFFKEDLFYFFSKIIFLEIFTFAMLLLCTLFDWVRYTIRLGPVNYWTKITDKDGRNTKGLSPSFLTPVN